MKIIMDEFNNSVVGYVPLDQIWKIMKKRGKTKKSFWKIVALDAYKKGRGDFVAGIKSLIEDSKTFPQFIKALDEKAQGYGFFPPMSSSFELYERKLLKELGKKMKVSVYERTVDRLRKVI